MEPPYTIFKPYRLGCGFVLLYSIFHIFAWESIFQMNVDYHFTTWKLGFLNVFAYLARYSMKMDPSVVERN